MTIWIIFDLLPTGPVMDAGMRLKRALKAVPPEAAVASLPALREALDDYDSGGITLTDGLALWLRALNVSEEVRGEIEAFITVASQHPKAVKNALEPVLEDLDAWIA